MSKNLLVFLGGTCGGNNWRLDVIDQLVGLGVPSDALFNPVVANWDDAAAAAEERAKKEASHQVYYLADPQEPGNRLSAYSMVEATMALYDRPEDTVVVVDLDSFVLPDVENKRNHAWKASNQTLQRLRERFPGAYIFGSQAELVNWVANQAVSAN